MQGDTTTTSAALPLEYQQGGKRTNYRWVICGLLFAATTINYLDRSVLNVIAPDLGKVVGWTDTEYGDINAAFTFAYALGFLFIGWFIDKVGVKIGYAFSLIIWSLAAAGHALVNTPLGFGIARFALGLGEAGNFPAAIKTTAEWFPRRDRALATGIFNAGSNVGAFLAPVVAPWLFIHHGWHSVFLVTGLIGILWVFFWLPMYRSPETHPRVNAAELAYIQSEPIEPQRRVRWLHLLPHRQTWAFAAGKFLTDPIWWFYLFWSGKFVSDTFNVSISKIGLPLIIIYVLADFGSVAGGWLSSAMLKAGFRPNVARKLAMLVCACFILPVIYAPITSNLWVAVTLIGVAAAAHQGFSANIFTTTSDMFPKWSVASVVGFGGMAGAMGGVLMQLASGRIHDATGSYLIMFIIAGTVYFLAILLFHLLAPRMDSVHLQTEAPLNVGLCASLAVLGALVGAAIAVPLTYLFQADFTTFAGYPSHALTALGHVFSKGEHQVMGRTVLSAVLCLAIFGAVAGATVGALLNAKRTQSASPAQ